MESHKSGSNETDDRVSEIWDNSLWKMKIHFVQPNRNWANITGRTPTPDLERKWARAVASNN